MDGEIRLNYGPGGLIPAIVQDCASGQVLMLAYMNEEAFRKTMQSGESHFWSRSRNSLWKKGETSGHWQEVKALYVDCDEDTVLLQVKPLGPACHTGKKSCFFQKVGVQEEGSEKPLEETPSVPACRILDAVYEVIEDRRLHPREDSYVSRLFGQGLNQVLKKVAEEAAEVVMAAKDQTPEALIYEVADLWFHSLVALSALSVSPEKVYEELGRRFGRSGLRKKASPEEGKGLAG